MRLTSCWNGQARSTAEHAESGCFRSWKVLGEGGLYCYLTYSLQDGHFILSHMPQQQTAFASYLLLKQAKLSRLLWESAFEGLGVHQCWSVLRTTLQEHTSRQLHYVLNQARLAEQQLLVELKRRKKFYDLWKQIQALQEDYRAVVHRYLLKIVT